MYDYNATVARVIDGDTIDLMVDVGLHATIHTHKDRREKYGRYLANVFVGKRADIGVTSVNEQLVKDGHAVVYDGGKG